MELKRYIYPLRRWWWLVAAATLVAAASSFLVTLQQPPVYQATTTLMMGRTIEDPNPSTSEFWLSQQLAGTYADIANREVVRNATMKALGINRLPQYSARAQPNSQLIEIAVVDTIPERAQIVANELANQLILQTPTSARPEEAARQGFVNQQLDTLEAQIKQTQDDISRLQGDLGNMVSARQISDTQNQISALQGKLSTLQSNYANLLANTQGGAINTLSVIEPAVTPGSPIGPNKLLSTLVAGTIGFVLAAGAAYLLEYLDDTVKSPDDIKETLGYPIIGYFLDTDALNEKKVFIPDHPRHPVTEAFRTLRTNLEFAAVDEPIKSILVSSADASEGKSMVASNLAIMIAQGEKKVILVDGDLRSPSIHQYMGLSNDSGLSEYFRGRTTLHNTMRIWRQDEKVAVITGGNTPPNPAELLGSKKMNQLLENLEEVSDFVILDGPPFVVADAALLASKVDGVILVVRPGYTNMASARAMAEQAKRSGANILGVVLNRIPAKLSDYYAGQVYLYPYYYPSQYIESGTRKPGRFERQWSAFFGRRGSEKSTTAGGITGKVGNFLRRPENPRRSDK